jgi:hypothetical protein
VLRACRPSFISELLDGAGLLIHSPFVVQLQERGLQACIAFALQER